MEQFGMFNADQDVLGDAQQPATPQPLVQTIRPGQGSISSMSTVPSPAISKGKDMETLKKSLEQEREEARRAKAERKKPAKAEKRKAAKPSRSS